MLAKGGFHSFEIHASAPNLDLPVLAAHALQQSVRPLAHQVARPKYSRRPSVAACNAIGGPKSQRHVRAPDDQLTDLAWTRVASIFVDQRQAVAWKRIA